MIIRQSRQTGLGYVDLVCSRKAQSEDSSWILSSGSEARITCHFALFLTCGSSLPDLLLCGRCTFWQNKAFSWHRAPLEFLLVCINPASFAFPTHIQCGHTWLSGFMVVLNPFTANVVHFLSPLGVIVKKWNEAFIRPLFRNCLPLTMPVMRKKQRRQHKSFQFWKDWKCFVGWKWKYF